ncbi:MAG: MerR family transcriptional regulator [Bacteroidales bacterium]|nr:MerR family transcriptional regulator [Bacteroidales bacterium]
MGKYSIKDLEKLSGIKAHTIRIWENRYKLLQPMRTATNIRYYCDNDLKRLLNISILNKNGFKISKIAKLESNELKEKVVYLIGETSDFNSHIESLIISMIELDELKFEKILNANILKFGFESTVLKIIYPLLERIGILWQTGKIKPAQEHFISNLIRHKIIVAIENIIPEENQNPKRFMLFLPEGELHELGLLFYSYLIKKKGHKIIYLGQSVPFDDIIDTAKIKQIDYFFTAFITTYKNYDLLTYIKDFSKIFSDKTIFILSSLEKQLNSLPYNFKLIDSHQKFLDYLEN